MVRDVPEHIREHSRIPTVRWGARPPGRPTSSSSTPSCHCRLIRDEMQADAAVPVSVPIHSKPSLELAHLVDAITIELSAQKREGRRDIERIRAILASWDASDRQTWDEFAQFDPDRAYTRNLIATDDENFTLMMLCWNKGRFSPIHDHANSECWVRVVQGTAREDLFETDPDPDKPLKLKKSSTFGPGAVTHIHDAIGIHRLGNPDPNAELMTLHCYSPPFQTCHIFPDQLSHGVECKMNFYSEHGKKHHDDRPADTKDNPCFCP